MLGARSARKLSRCRSATGRSLRITARAGCGTAIEYGFASLDPCAGSQVTGPGLHRRQNGGLVNRQRARLRHDHSASWRRGSCRRLGAACGSRSGGGLGGNRRDRGLRFRSFRLNFSCFRCGNNSGLNGGRGRNRLFDYRHGRCGRFWSGNCGFGWWLGRRLFSSFLRSGCGRLDNDGARRRRNHDNWTRSSRACGSLGDHRPGWRFRGNGRGRSGRHNWGR
jgi:hypothetical protein